MALHDNCETVWYGTTEFPVREERHHFRAEEMHRLTLLIDLGLFMLLFIFSTDMLLLFLKDAQSVLHNSKAELVLYGSLTLVLFLLPGCINITPTTNAGAK